MNSNNIRPLNPEICNNNIPTPIFVPTDDEINGTGAYHPVSIGSDIIDTHNTTGGFVISRWVFVARVNDTCVYATNPGAVGVQSTHMVQIPIQNGRLLMEFSSDITVTRRANTISEAYAMVCDIFSEQNAADIPAAL